MKNKPQLVILGGINGAGKSSTRDKYLIPDENNVVVIDPDKLSKIYREQGLDKRSADMQGSRLAISMFEQAIRDKKDIFLETTLSGQTIFNRMDKAKNSGYETTTVYVGLSSVEAHIARVAHRVENGGHHIPEETIRDRFSKAEEQLIRAFEKSDNFYYYDNSGNRPILAFEKNKELDFIIQHSNSEKIDNTINVVSQKYNIKNIKECDLGRELSSPVLGNTNTGNIIVIGDNFAVQKTGTGAIIAHETKNIPDLKIDDVGKKLQIFYNTNGQGDVLKRFDSSNDKQKDLKLDSGFGKG